MARLRTSHFKGLRIEVNGVSTLQCAVTVRTLNCLQTTSLILLKEWQGVCVFPAEELQADKDRTDCYFILMFLSDRLGGHVIIINIMFKGGRLSVNYRTD
ncbi:hypothetical protein AVEN_196343-1 [Araneus ventricosus]|uniref:Uncharacterized protein n=1 Tax=Araneus ventricosus TaxID=182803 RepID=A0A4Y2AW46_ARAVE|nr:hypothetical protein AVEN_196343-1 [Araneus ventricosus]